MASTVLAMKSRRLGPLRALAASMSRGIVSGEGRISVAPEAPGAKPTGYRTVFSVQVPEEFSAEDRRALRQRDSVPLLTTFGEWLTEQGRLALPKSPIGLAIAYAQSNWAALCRYPEHGDLSIDNNLAERMLRAQAIGRRNWTFLGSDRGGKTAAVLYSLTGTCRHHDIDPFAYLQDTLRRLPSLPTRSAQRDPTRRLVRITSVRTPKVPRSQGPHKPRDR